MDEGINSMVETIHQLEKENEKLKFRLSNVICSSFDWDKLANALKDKFGESLVEDDSDEEDAYNWWLADVTVTDIVEFIKNYR